MKTIWFAALFVMTFIPLAYAEKAVEVQPAEEQTEAHRTIMDTEKAEESLEDMDTDEGELEEEGMKIKEHMDKNKDKKEKLESLEY